MHAVSDSQVTSPDILSSSVQTQDWGAGVHVGVQLARHAVELAYAQVDSENMNCANTDKLWTAHAYLQPPFSTKSSAKAYNLVMDVRILSKNCSEQCEVLSKTAAIAIRDALVLQLCCDVDSMSYDCFKFAVESAFEIPNTKDFKYTCEEHDLVSQMHLSCNSIRTLARNRENFDQKMEKHFGPMLAEDLNTLFAAYVRCAATASFVKSDKARPKKGKRRERQTAYRPPDVCPRIWELQSDSAMLSHQYRCTSIVQSGAAESDWEPERERSVSMQCVPGGGPRVEMRQTAAEWLDSAS